LDAAVVLAGLVLELDADPFSHLEVGLASEADDALAAIAELDRLARFEVGHYGRRLRGRGRIVPGQDGVKLQVVGVVGW